MRRYTLGIVASACALLAQGCLLDVAPAREPADRMWEQRMLAGEYGSWRHGKREFPEPPMPDRIDPFVIDAALRTKYGIEVTEGSRLGGAAWGMTGGLIGRVQGPSATVELFGKEVARIHGPWYTVQRGRDFSYEFFLVVRPTATGRGRIIKRWRFPSEEVALTLPLIRIERLRRSGHSEEEIERIIRETPESEKGEFVYGYVRIEPGTETALVTIIGLKKPFEERVDLSQELRP